MDNIAQQIADAETVICDSDFLARKAKLDRLHALNERWNAFWSGFKNDAAALANECDADADPLACAEEEMAMFARQTERTIRLHYAKFYIE